MQSSSVKYMLACATGGSTRRKAQADFSSQAGSGVTVTSDSITDEPNSLAYDGQKPGHESVRQV